MAANVRRYGDTRGPEQTRALPLDHDWHSALPSLGDGRVVVRGLQDTDAPSLFALCADEPVGRFLWTPPSTMQRFEQFIDWTRDQQSTGRQICFAVVPSDSTTAEGLIQVRQIDPQFTTAEWGFVIAERYWGTGLFVAAARLVVPFLFETIGVHRLEARTVVTNGRANGALEKLGAIKEGRLRKAFRSGERRLDQYLWAILAEDWISAGIRYQDSGIRAGLGISGTGIRKQA